MRDALPFLGVIAFFLLAMVAEYYTRDWRAR